MTPYSWLIVFVVLAVIELATVNLVTIWFAFGSLAAAIIGIWIKDVAVQSTVFIIVSSLSLLGTWPLVKKFRKKEFVRTNLDMVVGRTGTVTKDISETSPGEVKVAGKQWTAISSKKIDTGKRVKIISIDGVKLKVRELEEVN